MQLLATIRTSDGSENSVSFYAGENLVGTVPEPPYSLLVSNLPAGTHVITAQNTDDFLQLGTSSPVTVTVTDLKLGAPRIDINDHFRFEVSGVVTGSPLVLFGSSNLLSWESIQTNVPALRVIELDVGPPTSPPQRFFRVAGEK